MMLKVYLFKVFQKGGNRYVGKAPAKLLAKLAVLPNVNETQTAQRPLEEKRLYELAEFAEHEGVFATSVVLGTTKKDLIVKEAKSEDAGAPQDLYYIELPETEDEIRESGGGLFNIIDGQHRLLSFSDKYCFVPDDIPFDLSFELYIVPTLQERQIIFKNTNEKQKTVSPNLLIWFRSELNMLEEDEKKYYPIIKLLDSEESSPLKGRIILSAEQINGGLKAQQLIKIFSRIHLRDLYKKTYTDEQIFKSIATYLTAWEEEVGTTFMKRDSQYGPFSKISGIRYVFALLPEFINIAKSQQKQFDKNFVRGQIKTLYSCSDLAITAKEFFDKTSSFNNNMSNKDFSSESNTWALAEKHKKILEEANKDPDEYDPFDAISS